MRIFKGKRGSLTVEASIALPFFIFTILTVASLMRLAYVHNIMQHAITDTANELATYSYLYSVSGAQQAHDGVKDYLGEKETTFGDHFATAMDAYEALDANVGDLEKEKNALFEGDPNSIQDIKNTLNDTKGNVDKYKQILNDIKNNPKGVKGGIKKEVVSLACLMANGAFEDIKGELASLAIEALIKKHLETEDLDANERLGNLNIKGGLDGLDFGKTTIFKDKETIDVVVSYDIKPIAPINIIPTFHITQRTVVKAWLDGDGNKPKADNEPAQPPEEKKSIWDLPKLQRGTEAQKRLGANVTTSTGGAVDKFDTATGEAIDIRTIDTTLPYNQKKGEIKKIITAELNLLAKYKGKITVDGSDKEYDIKKKKLLLVIPKGCRTKNFEEELKECQALAAKLGITIEVLEFEEKTSGAPDKEGKTKDDAKPTVKPTDSAPAEKVEPKFSMENVANQPAFQDNLKTVLSSQKMTKDQFDSLRLDNTKYLTDEEKQKLRNIRNTIKITNDTLVQKVVPLSSIDGYLQGTESWAQTVGGCVTRAQDTKDMTNYTDVYKGLALNYPNTRFNESDEGYGVLRYKATDESSYKIPYNPDMGGTSIASPPFTGNGFTLSEKYVVPEFEMKQQKILVGTELYKVTKDGKETLVGVYDGSKFVKVESK